MLKHLALATAVLAAAPSPIAGQEAPVGDGGLGKKFPDIIIQRPIGCGDSPLCERVVGLTMYGFDSTLVNFGDIETLPSVTEPPSAVAAGASEPPARFFADRLMLEDSLKLIDRETKICSSFDATGPSLWREALLQRRTLQTCQNAVQPLLEARQQRSQEYFAFLAGQPIRSYIIPQLLESYKDACLQTLTEYGESQSFSRLFQPAFHEELLQNLGILVTNGQHRCMASVVQWPTESDGDVVALVTAAHCLGATRSVGTSSRQLLSVSERIEFRPLTGQPFFAEVDPDLRDWIYLDRHDLAVIPLAAENDRFELPGFAIASKDSLKAWEPLYIFGVNPVVLALNKANGTTAPNLLEQSVTVSLGTPCRIYGVEDGALLHNCETEKQMSGSPVFILDGNAMRLAAVHTGGSDEGFSLPGCTESAAKAANRAVVIVSGKN